MNLKLLVAKREAMGLTQEQMSKSLGYKSKGSYCLIENGKARITIELAKKIKHLLKLTNKEFESIFFNEKVQETKTCKAM
jgi:DNA-binding XRE family transcriptional regulator